MPDSRFRHAFKVMDRPGIVAAEINETGSDSIQYIFGKAEGEHFADFLAAGASNHEPDLAKYVDSSPPQAFEPNPVTIPYTPGNWRKDRPGA